MARKAKSSGSAKKKGNKRKRKFTKEEILEDWKKAIKRALGKKKDLDPAIILAFEAKLLAKIQERLDDKGDYSIEGPKTRKVAGFIGRVSKELTSGNMVALAIFEIVFKLAKFHPACPAQGPGSGTWCDIQI